MGQSYIDPTTTTQPHPKIPTLPTLGLPTPKIPDARIAVEIIFYFCRSDCFLFDFRKLLITLFPIGQIPLAKVCAVAAASYIAPGRSIRATQINFPNSDRKIGSSLPVKPSYLRFDPSCEISIWLILAPRLSASGIKQLKSESPTSPKPKTK